MPPTTANCSARGRSRLGAGDATPSSHTPVASSRTPRSTPRSRQAARSPTPHAIEAVEVRCHPLVPELMGIVSPDDGLQARFSARHGVAVGLLDGRRRPCRVLRCPRHVNRTCPRLRALTEPRYPPLAATGTRSTITVRLSGGDDVEVHVAHARGSLVRPLTDAELDAKVDALIEPVLGHGVAATIRRGIEDIDTRNGTSSDLVAARPDRLEHTHDTHRRHGRIRGHRDAAGSRTDAGRRPSRRHGRRVAPRRRGGRGRASGWIARLR